MRQYVLTRSTFGPAWDLGANRRRFGMTQAVTARLMAAQTQGDWTWIVLLHERDPLLRQRLALYADSAPRFSPIVWRPPDAAAQWAAGVARRSSGLRGANAVAAHRAPWRQAVGPADDLVLMARLDDDDGFAPDALERYRKAAAGLKERTILMLPAGVWVFAGRYATVRHPRNAMHTLVTPPGDESIPYGYSHTKCREVAPVVTVDREWGWLWTRHRDTISNARNPRPWGGVPRPLDQAICHRFPVDWRAYLGAWA